MRITRCTVDGVPRWCEITEAGAWVLDTPADSALPPVGAGRRDSAPIESPRIGTAVNPGALLIALENYPSEREASPAPRIFPKGPRVLVAHESDVVLPREPNRTMVEPELAVVIGRAARDLAPSDVDDYIFGFTCFNDVTAVFDNQPFDFFAAKARDTFGPCGPWIETGITADDAIAGLHTTCRVDGEVALEDSTSRMIFDVRTVVAAASVTMTLLPGDLISLGSPLPPPWVFPGQEVEVEIERIGVLRNRFV